MSKPAAFRATYSDLKLIKTRGCVQIVFELPLADFDAAYELLGGMPNPSSERWFAIAALQAEAPANVVLMHEKRAWQDVQPAAQAGIRCNEMAFEVFLRENFADDFREEGKNAAATVRRICGVKSRVEFSTDRRARVMWHQLDQQYLAWKTMERQS